MAASWTARLFPSAVIDCWRTLMVAYREKRDEAAALRAVQAPRMAEEQREVVAGMHDLLLEDYAPDHPLLIKARAAFPEAFAGEVGE